jgi:ribonuclease HI
MVDLSLRGQIGTLDPMASPLKIFFDGGCRPNPGEMETAMVVGAEAHIRRNIGYGTSMDAEWLALIYALSFAQALGPGHFILIGDAAAVVHQANGSAKCRGAQLKHLSDFRALARETSLPRIHLVKRSHNLAGIALAKFHPR